MTPHPTRTGRPLISLPDSISAPCPDQDLYVHVVSVSMRAGTVIDRYESVVLPSPGLTVRVEVVSPERGEG